MALWVCVLPWAPSGDPSLLVWISATGCTWPVHLSPPCTTWFLLFGLVASLLYNILQSTFIHPLSNTPHLLIEHFIHLVNVFCLHLVNKYDCLVNCGPLIPSRKCSSALCSRGSAACWHISDNRLLERGQRSGIISIHPPELLCQREDPSSDPSKIFRILFYSFKWWFICLSVH